MRIFENVDGFSTKVNFVDENNRFVGYDFSTKCCEEYGYEICEKIPENIRFIEEPNQYDISEYIFADEKYSMKSFSPEGSYQYDTNLVSFRLIFDGKNDLYLCLWNLHNGCYAHGFDSFCGEDIL